MSLLSIALTFFLVANPIGNTPAFVSLVKDFEFNRQKKILFRESIIALLIAVFFQFFGEFFLKLLMVKDYSITLCGGALLFLTALSMIFPSRSTENHQTAKTEPMIVPIATPLISGPGLLTMIMLYSRQENNDLKILSAILLTWIGVTAVLTLSPYLQKILGKNGLLALEQLMGMILSMIAMEMVVKGVGLFVNAAQAGM